MKWRMLCSITLIFAVVRRHEILDFLLDLEDAYFPPDSDINESVYEELVRNKNGYSIKSVNESLFDCSQKQLISKIGEGWQKLVFKSHSSAIKLPNWKGPAHSECIRKNVLKANAVESCNSEMLRTFVDEIQWMWLMQNDPNVVKFKSYCIPLDSSDMRIETELGTPLDTIYLVQRDWNTRRKIIQDIVQFINRNTQINIGDFRRQQWIVADDTPKLTDLDSFSLVANRSDNSLASKIYSEFVANYLFLDPPASFRKNAKTLQKLNVQAELTISNLARLINY